ncbi:MAG TPA: VOC family protein [Alphaproteobacteria bacterium]|jgi:catechol-2,3-dioxygenase
MLSNTHAIATVAVKSLKTARPFYENVLGLTPEPDNQPSTVTYKAGGAPLLVYESQYAGSNEATAVTWDLGDRLESEVKALKAKGAAFEHYDMPDLTLKGDVHVAKDMKVAWLKDPDGNIHSLFGK